MLNTAQPFVSLALVDVTRHEPVESMGKDTNPSVLVGLTFLSPPRKLSRNKGVGVTL